MSAGPLMNLAIALGLFAIILLGVGAPTNVPTIASVSACVIPASATVRTCPPNATPTPAAAAHLQAGDRIVSFDGQQISSWDQVTALIHASAGRAVPITYERAGQTVTVQVPIVVNEIPVFDDNQNQIGTEQGGFLGIRAATEYRRESIGGAVVLAGDFIVQAGHAIIAVPCRIPALFGSIFEGQPRTDTDRWRGFVNALPTTARTAFVVTDSDSTFSGITAELPAHVDAVRLYENYLSTFVINQQRQESAR